MHSQVREADARRSHVPPDSSDFIQRTWIGVEEMNRALAREILARSRSTPSHTSHNKGGWRSHDDVHEWPLTEITRLREMIATAAPSSRLMRAWAIANGPGHWHGRHLHNGRLSGIYYVDDGGFSAATVFEWHGTDVRVLPEPGRMILFPSNTWHWTEPHLGERERITIAFDLG